MLDKIAWGELTRKRLQRAKVSQAEWDKRVERLLANPTTGAYFRFAKQNGCIISRDPKLPYSVRVKLSVLTLVWAIKAQDEQEFRRMVDEEIEIAAKMVEVE